MHWWPCNVDTYLWLEPMRLQTDRAHPQGQTYWTSHRIAIWQRFDHPRREIYPASQNTEIASLCWGGWVWRTTVSPPSISDLRCGVMQFTLCCLKTHRGSFGWSTGGTKYKHMCKYGRYMWWLMPACVCHTKSMHYAYHNGSDWVCLVHFPRVVRPCKKSAHSGHLLFKPVPFFLQCIESKFTLPTVTKNMGFCRRSRGICANSRFPQSRKSSCIPVGWDGCPLCSKTSLQTPNICSGIRFYKQKGSFDVCMLRIGARTGGGANKRFWFINATCLG